VCIRSILLELEQIQLEGVSGCAGDDNTVTFSFGALVEKIKNNLSAQAFGGSGSRSKTGSSAGLSALPKAAQLPKSSLSSAVKGPTVLRITSRMQAMTNGEPQQASHSVTSASLLLMSGSDTMHHSTFRS
jgi:hypothetical protein